MILSNKICCSVILCSAFLFSSAQICNYGNLGFELGNFSGWSGGTGTAIPGSTTPPNCYPIVNPWNPGMNIGPVNDLTFPCSTPSLWQHVVNTVQGIDGNCVSMATGLPDSCMTLISPWGGNCSARLGNANNGAQAEYMEFPFFVDSCYYLFSYSYAFIVQRPLHSCDQQPYFTAQILDTANNPISLPCASVATGGGFNQSQLQCNGADIDYKCWTRNIVDLSSYFGQNLKIRFTTYDCTNTGHFGYAYVDVEAQKPKCDYFYCAGNPNAYLVAPGGMTNFQWYDSLGNAILPPAGTNDTLFLTSPSPGTNYSVTVTSPSGCSATIPVTVSYSSLTLAMSSTPAVVSLSNGTATATPTGFGPYTYIWSPTGQTTQTATGLLPGMYACTVTDYLGCSAADSITVGINQTSVSDLVNESGFSIFPNPSSGIFTFSLSPSLSSSSIEIYNVFGGSIYKSYIAKPTSYINLSSQPKGIYFIRVQTEEVVATKKIVIQ